MKQKTTKKRRKYDASFKAEVLSMVSDGRPVGEAAQALGIGENLIYKWKRGNQAGQPANQVPPASRLQAENERLKAALRRAEQERDILKIGLHTFKGQSRIWQQVFSDTFASSVSSDAVV